MLTFFTLDTLDPKSQLNSFINMAEIVILLILLMSCCCTVMCINYFPIIYSKCRIGPLQ